MAISLFEKASKVKLRFTTPLGRITTEDLWDLPLTNLDNIAKSIHKTIKESEEESFISTTKRGDSENELKLDLVKHVIKCKLEAIDEQKKYSETLSRKTQLDNLILAKQNEAESNKSLDELIAERDKL